MILVLEQRGYTEKNDDTDVYQVSGKLLQLGTGHDPVKDVLESARPLLSRLVEEPSMACPLAVGSHEQLVIIARV